MLIREDIIIQLYMYNGIIYIPVAYHVLSLPYFIFFCVCPLQLHHLMRQVSSSNVGNVHLSAARRRFFSSLSFLDIILCGPSTNMSFYIPSKHVLIAHTFVYCPSFFVSNATVSSRYRCF